MLLRENDIFWIFRASSKSKILNWETCNASDFEQILPQRVKFRVKSLKTCRSTRKNMHSKNHVMNHGPPQKWHFSHSPCFFANAGIWIENITLPQIRKTKFHEESDFLMKIFWCGKFWNETLTTFQIWNKKNKTCQQLKKSWHSKNNSLIFVSPRKRHILPFSCFSEIYDFRLWFLRFASFWNQIIQHVRCWIKQMKTSQSL